MRAMRIGAICVFALGAVVIGSQMIRAEGQAQTGPLSGQHHIFVTPGDLTWQNGPPSVPAGAQLAVIEGDPKQPGLFTLRLKLPANYRIPPHWHPADEHVTVISGTFNMGSGDLLDMKKSEALPTGSFAVMPAKMHHFAWTGEETIIQLHGVGPWQINYINPEDDPRKTN